MKRSFIKDKVKTGEYDLSAHAHSERQEEQIAMDEIEQVLLKGVIIEQYSNDLRGEACLVAGKFKSMPLHAICGRRGSRLLIITVYRPKPPVWISYKKRAKELESRV